jgi:Zn-dependent protease with chaperone function
MKPPPLAKPSWLSRLGLAATSVLVIAVGFAVASVLFVVLLAAGLVAGGWLWWRLRQLARQAQQAAPDFIDGEYTVEPDRPLLEDRRTAPVEAAERSAAASRRAP